MTKAAALFAVGTLGVLAALDPPFTKADPPVGQPATVYVTQTRTVARRIEGKPVGWWRSRAVANRRALNASMRHRIVLTRRLHAQTSALRWRWAPTAREVITLAAIAYHQSSVTLYRKANCETGGTFDPRAHNPSGASGWFQFLPSTWATTPYAGFSPFDPLAASLAAAWMHLVGRGGEWVCQ